MIRLTHAGDGFIVFQKILAADFGVSFLLLAHHIRSGIDIVIIELENGRYVNSIRAWHTILTAGTPHERVILHLLGRNLQKLFFLIRQRLEIKERGQVVLEVIHICHTAQHTLYPRETAGKPECP